MLLNGGVVSWEKCVTVSISNENVAFDFILTVFLSRLNMLRTWHA
jgi:hypothetical protein